MTTENAVWPMTEVDLPQNISSWVSAHAEAIDSGETSSRVIFPNLAAAGLLDLGAPMKTCGGLVQQAAALDVLAQRSFSVAFSLWGHRMVLEFLELAGGNYARSVLPALRAGTIPGASAMAPGYKSLASGSDLALSITRDNSGRLFLSGDIAWASNLYSDAIAVAPAYGPYVSNQQGSQGGVIVAFPLNAKGVQIGPEPEILAMGRTASTSVSLDWVEMRGTDPHG